MAAIIDESRGKDKAAFVAFQQPAWHGLGKVFTEHLTASQALQEAQLDFTVGKLPNVHRFPDGTEIVSDESFFTFRDDTMRVLGSKLGSQYVPMQNADAFNFVDDLLEKGNAHIETAGALDGGKRVFITMKMANEIMAKRNDLINQYVVIANAHDGSLAITAMVTNIRVVCNNTLTAAMQGASDKIKVRHTISQQQRLQQALEILGVSDKLAENNSSAYADMLKHKISKEDLMDYFGNIVFTPEEMTKLRKGESLKEVASTRKQNILGSLVEYANKGVGQELAIADDGSLNMYYGYNAVTGWLTSKKYSNEDYRANSLLFGNSKTIMDTAADLALNTGKIQSLRKQSFDFNLN